jgi:hypothetical protein
MGNPRKTFGKPMQILFIALPPTWRPKHIFCDFGAFMASHGASCVLSPVYHQSITSLSPVYHLGSWLGEVFEARTKGTATRLRRNASKGASVRLVKAHKHHQVKVVQWFPNPPAMGLSENRFIIMFPMLRQARIDLREPSRNRDVPMNQPRLGINSQERDGEIIVPAPQNLRIDL